MKTISIATSLALAIATAMLPTGCSMEGRVIEARSFQVEGRMFVQERIVVSERPVFETRIVSRQVPR